jgi:hypothetical protein
VNVSYGWFVSLAASLLMTVAGARTYLAGPGLQFETDKAPESGP